MWLRKGKYSAKWQKCIKNYEKVENGKNDKMVKWQKCMRKSGKVWESLLQNGKMLLCLKFEEERKWVRYFLSIYNVCCCQKHEKKWLIKLFFLPDNFKTKVDKGFCHNIVFNRKYHCTGSKG